MTNCDLDHFDYRIRQPPTRWLLDERATLKTELRTHPVVRNFLETPVLPPDAATSADSPRVSNMSQVFNVNRLGGRARLGGPRPSRPTAAIRSAPGLAVKVFRSSSPIISARSHDRRCLEGSRPGDQVHPILWSNLRRATTERRVAPSLLCQRRERGDDGDIIKRHRVL